METIKICPNCRKPLPEGVPLGLCPECLIKSGFPTGTEPGAAGEAAGARFVPPPVSEIAQLFPQLEILRLIGKGGMGAVYKARQPALDRFVALKVLPPAFGSDPGFAERFNREARALARLNHPNIVTVYDFGKAGPLHYLLMEFVDGANLREVEQSGQLTPEQALAIVPQICEALQFAHDEGIVHRDIKPENLLLDKKGRLKIADFGIAKIIGQAPQDVSLTGAKDLMGTPHYMAPEQLEKPRSVDHRADIYSLGVVFYEMLTGELPLGKFEPPSKKVHIDVRLDEVVLQTLEKEPGRRYQHASQVKTAVETINRTPAPPPQAEGAARIEAILAQDYVLDIGHCLRRSWGLVRSNFWPFVGITALILLLLGLAGSVGGSIERSSSGSFTAQSTSVLGLLALGPLMGGLSLFFLKKIRGEPTNAETAFSGFSNRFLHLLLAGVVTSLLTGFGFICLVVPGIYVLVAWVFTLPLVIDKQLDFWPAMELSRKLVTKHWWKFLGFLIVLALLNLAGLLALFVGVFITLPVTLGAIMYAYEDVVGTVKIPSGAAAPVPPVANPARPVVPPVGFGVAPHVSGEQRTTPELNPWQPAILIVAALVCAALLLAAPVLPRPLSWIVILFGAFGLVVALLKLMGLWPLPSGLFPKSNWTARNLPSAGKSAPKDVPPSPGIPPAQAASDKIILPAFLLALFFGVFGAHRFYVGKYGTAVLQLCTLGFCGIWAVIDCILILCKAFTDGQGRRITHWLHPQTGVLPSAASSAQPASSGGGGKAVTVVAVTVLLLGAILVGALLLFSHHERRARTTTVNVAVPDVGPVIERALGLLKQLPQPPQPPQPPLPAPVLPPVRIKAGLSGQLIDSAGNIWLSDRGFSGGDTSERSEDQPIANTPDPVLYHSERYGMTSFSYPVPNGKYVVKLHFAETFDGITGPGERVFSFNIQGQEFKDFDIWAKAGGAQRAYVETVNVEVNDGKLNVHFTPQRENPEINGIEILPATTNTIAPPAEPAAQPENIIAKPGSS